MPAARDPQTGKFTKEEEVTTDPVEAPVKPAEETVTVEPDTKASKTEATPASPITPKIDTEKMKEELKGQISKEMADSIYRSLTGKDLEEDPNRPPWEKEGRLPFNYTEIAQWAKTQAMTELNAEIEAEDKAKAEQEKQAADQQAKSRDAWNKYWDQQLEELVAEGRIPAVKDDKDENDPGKKARLELFKQMNQVSMERQQKGLTPITDLHHVYYRFYKDPNAQPAGAQAPVYGARKSVSNGNPNQLFNSYSELRKSSLEDILAGR